MRRFFIGVAAVGVLALPASMVGLGLSSPAYAASTISCAKLKGKLSGTEKVTISKCSTIPAGYVAMTGSALTLATGGNLTWKNHDFITVGSPTTSSPGQGGCKAGATEEDSTGTVTGSSSDAFDMSLVLGTYSSRVCLKGTKLSLVPHTTATF
jgi:hypothetical protein